MDNDDILGLDLAFQGLPANDQSIGLSLEETDTLDYAYNGLPFVTLNFNVTIEFIPQIIWM